VRDGAPADVIDDLELFGVRKPSSDEAGGATKNIDKLTWLDDD
jgi:hypothetical protein